MPTKSDIDAAQQDAQDSFDEQLEAAVALKNASSAADAGKMTPGIQSLRAQRTAIAVQTYQAGLDSNAMAAALSAIQAATQDMTDVAKIMQTVTGFVTNVASFVGAGAKVVSALKGVGHFALAGCRKSIGGPRAKPTSTKPPRKTAVKKRVSKSPTTKPGGRKPLAGKAKVPRNR